MHNYRIDCDYANIEEMSQTYELIRDTEEYDPVPLFLSEDNDNNEGVENDECKD